VAAAGSQVCVGVEGHTWRARAADALLLLLLLLDLLHLHLLLLLHRRQLLRHELVTQLICLLPVKLQRPLPLLLLLLLRRRHVLLLLLLGVHLVGDSVLVCCQDLLLDLLPLLQAGVTTQPA
jgi:hypothetical protein